MARMMASLSFVVGLFMNLWSAALCVSSIGTSNLSWGFIVYPNLPKQRVTLTMALTESLEGWGEQHLILNPM